MIKRLKFFFELPDIDVTGALRQFSLVRFYFEKLLMFSNEIYNESQLSIFQGYVHGNYFI